jgi:hypothetical protein
LDAGKKIWINGWWATPDFEWFPNFQFCETSYNSLVQHNRALNIWRCRWDRLGHALKNKGCLTHYGLAIYILKYLKAKEEIMKTQIFHHAKIQSSKIL